MNAATNVLRTRLLLCAATLAGALIAGNVVARDVTIAIHVGVQGLDLSRPADAHTFYVRLKRAARDACTHGNRVGLEPVDDFRGCYEGALARAVRSANAPMLSRVYLAEHTLREAVTYGIDVPPEVARN